MNIQLLNSVILLTPFLHYFGHINGPFFVLYLLTVMESFLNLNFTLSYFVVAIMIFSTVTEYIWLIASKEIVFTFISAVECFIRVISIIFISAYGFVLANKTLSEEKARHEAQSYAKNLEKASKKLKKANVRLTELSRLKDEFVSIASHELRTPMTVIKGYLWLVINKESGKLSEEINKNLKTAYQATERAISLVGDMLTVSRIEGNRLVLKPSVFNIGNLAKQAAADLAFKAKERDVIITVNLTADDIMVTADQDKIREVIQNLVENAIKYSPVGRGIEVGCRRNAGFVEISVTDHGMGINKRDLPNLFQKFSRLDNSYSKMAEVAGTGLGLYITKKIIALHKGRVWVKSSPGMGSTFSFSLPVSS